MTAPQVQPIIDAAWAADQAANDAALAAKDAIIAQCAEDLAAAQAQCVADLAAAQAETAAVQQQYADYQQQVVTTFGPMAFAKWDETHCGTRLDLTGYVETFRDDFTGPTINNTTGPWYTGSSAHGSFGGANFKSVGSTPDPYLIIGGEGRIRCQRVVTNPVTNQAQWQSGLIQSVNRQGVGFSQAMGYFEARLKFPTNGAANASVVQASWPALWLLSVNEYLPAKANETQVELDIVEAYGSDPNALHATIHYKPAPQLAAGAYPIRQSKSMYAGLNLKKNLVGDGSLIWGANANMFNGQYKTYGVLIGDDIFQIFVDGYEVARFPTQDWMRTPLYMLVDLTLLDSEKTSSTPTPQDLYIDYVRAMAKI